MTATSGVTARWQGRLQSALWLAVLTAWLVGLFRQGLFFPMQQLVAGLVLALLSAAALALSWRSLGGWRPRLMDLGLALIAVAYIASMHAAVRPNAAALEAVLVLVGLALFAAVRAGAFGRPALLAAQLRFAAVAGASLVTVGGLLAAVGIVHMAAPTLGGMLVSTFTYHNSYAAFALVGLILALSGLAQPTATWVRAALAVAAAWTVIGIALSQSRGVWLVAPVVLVVWLSGLPAASRGRAFLLLCAVLAAGAVGTPWALSGLERDLPHHMLAALVLSAVMAGALALAVDALWRHRTALARRVALAAGVVGVLGGLVGGFAERARLAHAIPSVLAARASSISLADASVQQRIEMFRIAFQLIRQEPLTGDGGGAWPNLYHNLSTSFFVANQTHSIATQIVLEAGALAALGLALAVVGAVAALWRVRHSPHGLATESWGLGMALFALMGHAAFDWDLSFFALAALAWMLAGACLATAAAAPAGVSPPGAEPVPEASGRRGVLRGAALGVAVVATLACASLALARAELGAAQVALREGHNATARRGAMASLALDPWSSAAYATAAAAAPTPLQRVSLLRHGASLSPDAPDAWSAYATALLALGRTKAALRASTYALAIGPWDILAATATAQAADAGLRHSGLARRSIFALTSVQVDVAEQGGQLVVPIGSGVPPQTAQAQLEAALGEGDVLSGLPATAAQLLESAVAAEPALRPRLSPWLATAARRLGSRPLAGEAAAWAKAP